MKLTLYSILGISIMLGLGATGSRAATALGVREATPEASTSSQVPVALASDVTAVALQADVLFSPALYDVGDATGGTQPEGVQVQSRLVDSGVLRVVVHHRSSGALGSDVVFQIPLTAKAGVVSPDPVVLTNFVVSGQGGTNLPTTLLPKVRLVGLRTNGGINGRQGIELSAVASATTGNITKVEYYVGGLKIGEATSGNFAILWTPPSSGPFEVKAVAFDSNGQQTESRTIPVIITHVGTYASPVVGSYYGLVRGQTFSFANDGYVTMTTALNKSFTLKLLVGGKTWPGTGNFDTNGNATIQVKRTGMTPLTVVLAHSSSAAVEQIFGRVADGAFVPATAKFTGNTFETEFTANRVVWKLKTREAPQNGVYTMLMPVHEDAVAQNAPRGTGFGTVTVGKDGSAKLVGTLADGSPGITASSFLSKDGFWPVYASLYTNKGVIMGELSFLELEDISDFNGPLTWMRPADTKAAMFKLGFGTTLDTIGSRFVKPGLNSRLFPLANVGGNSLLFLSEGGLPSELERLVLLTAANKGIVPTQGADIATFVPVPTTGLIAGTFLHEDTQKSVAYKGAVLQKQNLAAGFFPGGLYNGDMSFNANPDLAPGTGDAGPIGTNPLPVVKITSPAVNSTLKPVVGNVVQVKGTATDKQGIANVKIQVLHNGVLSPAVNAVGTTAWTYDLAVPTGEGGLYVIYAKATDSSPAADESEVLAHAFWVPLKSALVVAVNDATKGSVTTGYLGSTQRDVGKMVTITATPKTKKKFVGWTGGVTSASPKITVLMKVGLTLTANFSDISPQ